MPTRAATPPDEALARRPPPTAGGRPRTTGRAGRLQASVGSSAAAIRPPAVLPPCASARLAPRRARDSSPGCSSCRQGPPPRRAAALAGPLRELERSTPSRRAASRPDALAAAIELLPRRRPARRPGPLGRPGWSSIARAGRHGRGRAAGGPMARLVGDRDPRGGGPPGGAARPGRTFLRVTVQTPRARPHPAPDPVTRPAGVRRRGQLARDRGIRPAPSAWTARGAATDRRRRPLPPAGQPAPTSPRSRYSAGGRTDRGPVRRQDPGRRGLTLRRRAAKLPFTGLRAGSCPRERLPDPRPGRRGGHPHGAELPLTGRTLFATGTTTTAGSRPT